MRSCCVETIQDRKCRKMVFFYEAIDRININENFLSVFPLKLLFGPCEVASTGCVYMDSDACLVITESSYSEFIKLLFKVLEYFTRFHNDKSQNKNVTHGEKELVFNGQMTKLKADADSISWHITVLNKSEITINKRSLRQLSTATTQLLLKSYCYNIIVTNSLNSFLQKTSINILQTLPEQNDSIFENYNINNYLLKELVYRHEKIILLLKEIIMQKLPCSSASA